ncbi:MAG: LysR substrate-binding domain-containing protein [Pseudomonadota bacterium]|nr:LysR substrate-binding domain-containing protein [Pseudomonadota bacterium]
MTLEQLRIFVAVADAQHITRAADGLNLTQSAVSGSVAALEARHGVRLFDRVGRSIALNETGRALLVEARAILAQVAAAETVLADMAALRTGRLTIHASQTIASYWLPKRLVAFHAEHPGVELDVRVGNTREAADAVRNGEAELGYVEGDVHDPHLSDETVGEDRLVLLVKADHPWGSVAGLTAADLRSQPWVLREAGSGTRSSLEAGLRSLGVEANQLRIALTLPSNEAVLAAVLAGAGVTALSESVAAGALARGSLVKAPLKLPARTYRLLRHKERYRTRAADAFVALALALKDLEPGDNYVI